jgi:hypothetical protein
VDSVCDRLLTVIFAHRGIPTPTEVDAVHPPLEVVQGIRVSPIRAAGRASGIRGTTLSLSLEALCGLLLFLTDSMFLIFLPTYPPGDRVSKWGSQVETRRCTSPSMPCHLYSLDSRMT